MNRPVRTTVVFSLVSGVVTIPMAMLLATYLYWPMALKLTLWANLAVYGVFMARWSKARTLPITFPLAILLGAALWPQTNGGFYLLAVGTFSWMRSGICFKGAPLRSLAAELITIIGGAGLLLLISGHTYPAWALSIMLFFLVQSLYFFIVPMRSRQTDPPVATDPFVKAAEDAQKVLEGL